MLREHGEPWVFIEENNTFDDEKSVRMDPVFESMRPMQERSLVTGDRKLELDHLLGVLKFVTKPEYTDL